MKKMLVVALMALGLAVNAQEGKLNVGLNLGLPMGDASDAYSFVLAPEANYLFQVSDKVLVGPTVSFYHFFGKEIGGGSASMGGVTVSVPSVEVPNASLLPIGGAVRFNATPQLSLGVDLGYALSISNSSNSLHYRPVVGYRFSHNMTAQLSYSGFSKDGVSMNALGLGVVLGL